MTDDIKPVAWAIFRDGALDWEHDQPFSDEPMSMMDDEESRPLYGGEVIAEIERLRADRDDVRAELTNLQIAFNDWKVTHSTVRLEVEIERLRAELERKSDTAVRNKWMAEVMQEEVKRLRADAERYRWLRERAPFWAWQPDSNCYPGITVGFSHSGTKYCDYTLDEAIDAAMKEAK